MKQKKEVFAKGICFQKTLWVFLIGSIFGVVMETIVSYFQYGDFESRKGLIYGPLNPVYGFGAVIFMIFLVKYKNPLKVFFGGMLLGGGFEYLCSIIQEKVFGTTSWDYSGHAFNIGGRTSLFIMISGRCSNESRFSTNRYVRSSDAARNSLNVNGNIFNVFTFPTGTAMFFRFTATPNNDPAATT